MENVNTTTIEDAAIFARSQFPLPILAATVAADRFDARIMAAAQRRPGIHRLTWNHGTAAARTIDVRKY